MNRDQKTNLYLDSWRVSAQAATGTSAPSSEYTDNAPVVISPGSLTDSDSDELAFDEVSGTIGQAVQSRVATGAVSIEYTDNAPVIIPDGYLADSEDSDSSVSAEEESLYSPVLRLEIGAKSIPHPEKEEKGGEDAYLISNLGAGVICVADGVGGYAEEGIDPSLYSREFVRQVQLAVEAAEHEDELDPRRLLEYAHERTFQEGAATAVIAVLEGESCELLIANLGDSGVKLVRDGQVIFSTTPQEHYFDCPYQFLCGGDDTADRAQVYKVPVQEGDLVIAASDGLFDNVYDKDIESVVHVFGGTDSAGVHRTATAIAALASKHSHDKDYMSPYVVDAIEQGRDLPVWQKLMGKSLTGGKIDDITVVVASVVKAAAGAGQSPVAEGVPAEDGGSQNGSSTSSNGRL